MADLPNTRYPAHPAHVAAYVEVLGPALALEFFLQFGGCPSLYFPSDPKGKSAAEALVGPVALKTLGERLPAQRVRVPRPRTWMIHALTAEGRSQSEVCRLAGCSSETVRRALKLAPNGASHPAETTPAADKAPSQLKLF